MSTVEQAAKQGGMSGDEDRSVIRALLLHGIDATDANQPLVCVCALIVFIAALAIGGAA